MSPFIWLWSYCLRVCLTKNVFPKKKNFFWVKDLTRFACVLVWLWFWNRLKKYFMLFDSVGKMKIYNICCNFNNYMINSFHLQKYISNMKIYLKFGNLGQGSQFCTIPYWPVWSIFYTGSWNNTETSLFRTNLNTGSTRSILTVPAEIQNFSRKIDTGAKQKYRFLCNFSLS